MHTLLKMINTKRYDRSQSQSVLTFPTVDIFPAKRATEQERSQEASAVARQQVGRRPEIKEI